MSEEMIDVLDEQGNKTGEVLPKDVVHDRELRHGGTHIWIYNSKGEVLLQKRSKEKKISPNRWDISVAGHISTGETPTLTGVREAHEELGLEINESELEFVGVTSATPLVPALNKLHRVFDWTYLVKKDTDISKFVLQQYETDEVKWLHIDELEKEILAADYQKNYGQRDRYLFLLAAAEIRKRVNHIGGVS